MEQFKVGDWVRSTKYLHMAPCKVESIFESNERKGDFGLKSRGTVNYASEAELWQPKKGEWCWFCDDTEGTPIFGRFYKQDKDFGNCCYPQHQINSPYSYCEPFIGELPSFLKGTI